MDKPIAVLGAGSWGTALALLLANNRQETRLWGYNASHMQEVARTRCNNRYLPGVVLPDQLLITSDLQQCLADVQDVLIVVPSDAFAGLLTQIKSSTTVPLRLIWGTKGLDPRSGQLLHIVAENIFGTYAINAVMAGPSFAAEVAKGLPTAVTVATHDPTFAADLVGLFSNNNFRVYSTNDIIGVEICGAVKNILAIAGGIIDGLKLGANALSALITRGLAEMSRLGIALGGKPATFMGLAGVGDLVLTCSTNQSRNRRFGSAIALGKTIAQAQAEINQVIEGLSNLKPIYALAKNNNVEMPITEQIYKVVYENLAAEVAIRNLFARISRSEAS